jgi:alanine--tRNA ligase
MAGVKYKEDEKQDVSIRVITDHIRSVTFMVSDGIMPSNEGRGYVLRRLLRRAARHGRLLGIQDKFLSKLCETVIEGSKDGYPELEEKKEFITKVISEEEEKFNKTIDQGLSILADMEKALEEQNKNVLSGEDTFKLYDTYGFPIDLTKEILEEKNITIDEEGFSKCMNEQREKARKARKVSNYMGADATVYDEIDPAITSEFVGYDKLKNDSKVTVLTTEEDVVEALSEGDKGTIIVDETVFYATMGGQEGDKGYITSPEGEFKVDTTIKLKGGKIGHVGVMTKGMIKAGDTVTLLVDSEYRADTCKNHSATHLLQKALRTVLGNHVEQKGSYVDPERLRFDFTHFQSMTAEELKKVEDIVNEKIVEAIPVETKIMTIEEAKKTGAMALFGEKYGESVRVVCIDDFSKEFCGGTHVANTANIRLFKIISEAGVAAGVRRIEALTDKGVLKYYEELEKLVKEASEAAKTESVQLVRRIHTMNDEIKALSSENEKLKAELANNALGDVSDNVVEIKGVKFVATKVDNVDMNELRNLGDKIKNEIGSGVVLVVSAIGNDKVNMIAMATDDAVAKGAHAGNLIKTVASLVGGGGGGRPNMAQAGGKNPAGIPELLKKAPNVLEEQL